MKLLRSNAATLTDLLPDKVMTRLQAAGRTRRYRDGELIQQRGDAERGLSILRRGNIIAGNIGTDGSFVVSSVPQPGECFGEFTLFAGLPRTHDLSASGAVELLYLSERAFLDLFDREPSIGKALLAVTLRRTHDLLEFLDGQRRLSVPVRLAKVLLSFLSPDNDVRCRQEELAYMLGVTRATVNKALKALAAEGFVRLRYGVVLVDDPSGLRRWVAARSLVVPVTATVLETTR
ncbi:MAG: Crp/Fnr family transcriptional regulator [Pseudomonadota bacterium]